MDMISLNFYVWVTILVIIYYLFPIKWRWYVLLAGSLRFYWLLSGKGIGIFLSTIVISYGMGMVMERLKNQGKQASKQAKLLLFVTILMVITPLFVIKLGDFILTHLVNGRRFEAFRKFFIAVFWEKEIENTWIVPIGLAFYTMQIIAYIVDVYRGNITAEKNFLRYVLFVSFFPQIVQGPIPRYEQLGSQLWEGHPFQEKIFIKGCLLIVWGFFLKMMIADKAAVIVNTIFQDNIKYPGGFILVAGCLYSIQLYTDFLSCVCIAQGVAELFGIELADNFHRPYLAISIQDFWRRWHISLSSWLRDYIYIPLGGSRKGRLRKYRNLLAVFSVSGLWHGIGVKYLAWGLLHGFYQIVGEMTMPLREKSWTFFKFPKEYRLHKYIRRGITFLLVMPGWIIFRADNLKQGISMIISMVQVWNPWIFFNDSLFQLGLSWKEWAVLAFSILLLQKVSIMQENNHLCIRDWIVRQHILLRWGIYIGSVLVILVFGTYGFGFQAQDFIYGGF